MSIHRRSFALSVVALAAHARAQDRWPARPITYVVPYHAGGGTDIIGRLLSARLGPALGTTFAVVNREGSGGNIGAAVLARAAPDGYTVGGGSIASHAINASLYPQRGHYPAKDFSPITLVGVNPNLLIVNADAPFQAVQQLIAAAKAKPGSLSCGARGTGAGGTCSISSRRNREVGSGH